MKRKIYLMRAAMTLLLAVLSSTGAWAADVVTVGSGTTANGNLPSNQFSNYFVSQQIYTSSEIGRAGMITSIAFYNYDTGRLRDYDIYLTHIDKNAFDNNIDWVMVAEADKVFSGKVTLIDWTAIELDKPFVYNGTKNLLLTVVDHSNSRISNDNSCCVFDGSSQALYYNSSVSLDPTQPMEKEGTINNKKNVIQLCFDTYPKPNKLEAVEVGDVRALIQWSLRGDATATNLRYRKVGTEAWTTMNDLTTRSKTIENLDPATQYETQVQAVFSGNKTSDWTDVLTFTTSCCPLESQAEIIYKLNSTNGWFNSAVQIVDVTNEDKPIEVAYLRSVNSGLGEGIVTLCCGHSYKVNWIYDEARKWNNSQLGFTLYFQPGDAFYTMAFGEAPEENAQLTEFVMDCGDYCAPMPKNVSVDDIFHDGAILSFTSTTAGGKIAYSTEADFNPATATNTLSVTFDAGGNGMSEGSSGGSEVSYRLTGLESQTDYYVALQSVCTAQPWDDGGHSRWTKPIKVTTGAEEAPVDNISVIKEGSTKAQIDWVAKGKEMMHNVYIRQQTGTGTAVSSSQVQVFDLDGDGNTFTKTGEDEWGSFIYSSTYKNILTEVSKWFVVTNVPADAVVKVNTKEGKSKSDLNEKTRVTEVFSVGAEKQIATGENIEELRNEISTKITSLNEKRKSGRLLTKMGWKKKYREYKKLRDDYLDGTNLEDDEEFEQKYKNLKRELGLDKKNVKRAVKHGVSAGYKAYLKAKKNKARTRNSDDNSKQYFVWINHEEGNGFLNISELEIVLPENMGEWTVYSEVTGNSYTFTDLTPGTTYEVVIEPVYDDGTTGPEESVMFTTLGEEADPIESVFSVSNDKKVSFAKGNLRYQGNEYEGTWLMAQKQYEVLGEDNIDKSSSGSSYPADLIDLLCWSTAKNRYGVSTYYGYDDEEANLYFQGDFADWGENATLISDLGLGWSTLSKDEWDYLLTKRENSDKLKALATVADVKGLVLLPDGWTGATLAGTYSAEGWTAMEKNGAVFLPATGHLYVYKDENNRIQTDVNGLDMIGNYWTSTPSGEESGLFAFTTMFNLNDSRLESAEMERRLGCAVRLVKEVNNETDLSNIFADGCSWATYVAEESLTTPEGLQAYVVSETTVTEVTATPVDYIPAGVAVLLNRTEASVSDYKAKPYAGEGKAPVSLLVGSATESTGLTPYQDFVLYNDEFVLSSVATVAAGHAYLPVTTVPAGARTMIIVIGGDATAIKSIKHVSTDNDAWYTIDGRRLNRKPTAKGLYIHHDKKFVIK